MSSTPAIYCIATLQLKAKNQLQKGHCQIHGNNVLNRVTRAQHYNVSINATRANVQLPPQLHPTAPLHYTFPPTINTPGQKQHTYSYTYIIPPAYSSPSAPSTSAGGISSLAPPSSHSCIILLHPSASPPSFTYSIVGK